MMWRSNWVLFLVLFYIETSFSESISSQFAFLRIHPRQTLRTESSRLVPVTSRRRLIMQFDPGSTGRSVFVDRQGTNPDSQFLDHNNQNLQGSGTDRQVGVQSDPSGQYFMEMPPAETSQSLHGRDQGGQLPDHLRVNKPLNQQKTRNNDKSVDSRTRQQSGNIRNNPNRRVQQQSQMSQDPGTFETFIDPMQVRMNNRRFNPSDSFFQTSQMGGFDVPFHPAFFGEENDNLPFLMNGNQQFMNPMFAMMQPTSRRNNVGSRLQQFIPSQRSNNAGLVELRNVDRSQTQQRRQRQRMEVNPIDLMVNSGLFNVKDEVPGVKKTSKISVKDSKRNRPLKPSKSFTSVEPTPKSTTKTTKRKTSKRRNNKADIKTKSSMSKNTVDPIDYNAPQEVVNTQQIVLRGIQGGPTTIRLKIEGKSHGITEKVLMDLLSDPNVRITKRKGKKNQITTGQSLLSILTGQSDRNPSAKVNINSGVSETTQMNPKNVEKSQIMKENVALPGNSQVIPENVGLQGNSPISPEFIGLQENLQISPDHFGLSGNARDTVGLHSNSQLGPDNLRLFGNSQQSIDSFGLNGNENLPGNQQVIPENVGLQGNSPTSPENVGLQGNSPNSPENIGLQDNLQISPEHFGISGNTRDTVGLPSNSQLGPDNLELFGNSHQSIDSFGLNGNENLPGNPQVIPENVGLQRNSPTSPENVGLQKNLQLSPEHFGLSGNARDTVGLPSNSQLGPDDLGLFGNSQQSPNNLKLFGNPRQSPNHLGLFGNSQQSIDSFGLNGNLRIGQETFGLPDNLQISSASFRLPENPRMVSENIQSLKTDTNINNKRNDVSQGIMIPNDLLAGNKGHDSFSKSEQGSTNAKVSKEIVSHSAKREKKEKPLKNREMLEQINTPDHVETNGKPIRSDVPIVGSNINNDGFISAKPAVGLFQELPTKQNTNAKPAVGLFQELPTKQNSNAKQAVGLFQELPTKQNSNAKQAVGLFRELPKKPNSNMETKNNENDKIQIDSTKNKKNKKELVKLLKNKEPMGNFIDNLQTNKDAKLIKTDKNPENVVQSGVDKTVGTVDDTKLRTKIQEETNIVSKNIKTESSNSDKKSDASSSKKSKSSRKKSSKKSKSKKKKSKKRKSKKKKKSKSSKKESDKNVNSKDTKMEQKTGKSSSDMTTKEKPPK